jgi:hypothetical protein
MTKPDVTRFNMRVSHVQSCTDLYDRWILFTSFYELVIGQPGILVLIHIPEDLIHSLSSLVSNGPFGVEHSATYLLGRVFVCWQLHHLSSHLVYGLDNHKHFVVCNRSIFVYVIQLECPWTML